MSDLLKRLRAGYTKPIATPREFNEAADEIECLAEQNKALRDAVQHIIDEAKLTSSQYEVCRQALAATGGGK